MKRLIYLTILFLFLSGCESKLGVSDISSTSLAEKFDASEEIKSQYTLEGTNLKRTVSNNPKDKIEVEIGNVRELLGEGELDVKEPEFTPDVKISRWDDEVNFTLHPTMLDKVATENKSLSFEEDKIKFSTLSADYKLYELPVSKDNPEGAFEYEIDLKEKPESNTVEFDITTKNLKFSYQPPLDDSENIKIKTEERNIGSYAVYSSENKINREEGKNYKNGKVGQLFRPKMIDATGKEFWGEFNKDLDETHKLIVTLPEGMVYPIKHAAGLTFGYTTISTASGVTLSSYSAPDTTKWLVGTQFALPVPAYITSITAYINDTSAANKQYGIYDELNNLKGTTVAGDLGGGTDWYTLSFSSPALLSAGNYTLVAASDAANGSSNDTFYCDNDGTSKYITQTNTSYVGSFPATWSPTGFNNKFSIYATYLNATTTFTSSGTWTAGCTGTVPVLVVAGAGGGGGAHGAIGYVRKAGGGGGAGGLVYNSSYSVNNGSTYTVTVGTGGTGGVYNVNGAAGYSGTDSVFGTITATGGGGGGGADGSPSDAEMSGRDGGSGGGVAVGNYDDAATYGDETSGQGYHGGNNYYDGTTTHSASGGGGGAGAVGGNAASATRGGGGSGASYSISGSSVTYATGGNGGAVGTAVTGAAGTDGLGNGGGGAVSSTILSYSGGDGGDGVVIVGSIVCTSSAIPTPIPDDAFFD